MAAQPNIGNVHRLIYVAGGMLLIAGGFFWVEAQWLRAAMPIGGAVVLVEGLVGW